MSVYNILVKQSLSVTNSANLRWNFLTVFLVEVSGCNHESYQTEVLVWFSTHIFPFYKMRFTNRLEFSCFADFLFVCILKPPVEGLCIAWSKRLGSFIKLMLSKNSISGKSISLFRKELCNLSNLFIPACTQ